MKGMRTRRSSALMIASGLTLLLSPAQRAEELQGTDRPGAGTVSGTRIMARETVTGVVDVPIPNITGKRLVSRIVEYPPGGGSVSHHHARSAFIYAHVLSGSIRSQVNDEPARVYRAGETWLESPGSYHRVSENASDSVPARLLAVIVVDAADTQLTIPDPR